MFKRLWNSLSCIGVKVRYDDKLIKRITLTNQFSFIAFIVCLFSGLNNFVLGDVFSAVIIEFFALLCLSSFALNQIGLHKFATSFLLVALSTAIFYFDSYSGLHSGTFLYFFPLILAISFVHDSKEKMLIIFHLLLPLIFLFINVSTHYTLFKSAYITEDDRYQMFFFNLMFSAASIAFFVYLTIASNIREGRVFEQRMNERKATEQAIKHALTEKDILLAEIHHRVKNNLAIIASLFNLQMSTVENEDARNILMESKNRVKSMALIHDRLYKSDNMTDVDFAKYTKDLVDEIQYSYPTVTNAVVVNTHISNIQLNVNTAIPCGLILNELLTNCYKYAFVGRTDGMIDIEFTSIGNMLRFVVKDNGVGLKEDYEKGESLGMVVIQSLSEQLDGEYKFTVNKGTCFELKFEQHLLS
ncbi:MAG: signal transduction histidine kinase [Bacteroidetes bacterium]|nr:signal transduction histidine kinase [Bacteroidota bacterium]